MRTFGETVAIYLDRLDMRSVDLANRSGQRKDYISRMINNGVEPTWPRALLIIDALGVDINEFKRTQQER